MTSRDRETDRHGDGTIGQALRGLRAVRDYGPAPVPDSAVLGWLETARWCGSSRNSQPWRFIVVRSEATLGALSSLGQHASHLAGADVAIAIAMTEGPYPFSTVLDLGRVVQSLMLAAHADGIGACIAVFEPAENVAQARSILGVPVDARLDLAIAFGVADRRRPSLRSGSPPGRLPLDQLVSSELYGEPI